MFDRSVRSQIQSCYEADDLDCMETLEEILPEGLITFNGSPNQAFDAIIIIKNESPLKIISYGEPY